VFYNNGAFLDQTNNTLLMKEDPVPWGYF